MTGIAVVGNRDFILGFKLAGIRHTYKEENIENRINAILAENEADILVIQDEEYKNLSSSIKKKLQESVKPIVIPVGKLEEDDLREKIRTVIGIDLYKK